ncbi:MAG: M48 family metallopeptidase [Treponema sp.]|nr:M48 family metallopeptidase [Treponema sp.]
MKKIFALCLIFIVYSGCEINPFTGQWSLALIPDKMIFSMADEQYGDFLSTSTIVTGTPEAEMIARVGANIVEAAQKLAVSVGRPNYFNDYNWEFNLIQDNTINAWVMPGGKIVFYTGILPITQNEAGVAGVMGHEVAHAFLNHGRERMSAGIIQQLVGLGLSIFVFNNMRPEAQALAMMGYTVGTNLVVMLPFSRQNEDEADVYGQLLMAIAGYDPDEASGFWERMRALGDSGTPEFLRTHPTHDNRINNLQANAPEARRRAIEEFGVTFD